MTLQYENRMGDTYYLQQGTTPTGKPKYYMGRKITGTPLDALPEGYEIHEDPERAQVRVRKPRPTAIAQVERELVVAGLRRYGGPRHAIVEVEGNSLVVYTPSMSEAEARDLFDDLRSPFHFAPSPALAAMRDRIILHGAYSKMLRFVLADAAHRLFYAERWCFLGSIDNWVPIASRASLAEHVAKFVPHLERESFFELM